VRRRLRSEQTGPFPSLPVWVSSALEGRSVGAVRWVRSQLSQARKLLAEDKAPALKMIAQAGEHDLDPKIATAPWDGTQLVLGQRMLQMVTHLEQHKGQLFYYLKLQGKPVNTGHLWGAS